MTKNQGLKFENEFGRWLARNHQFVIKLPDTRSLRLKSKLVSLARGVTFKELTGTKTPADFWSVNKTTSCLWECKHTNLQSLPVKRIAPHQKVALDAHAHAGGKSFVVIGWANEKCTILEVHNWDQLVQKAFVKGRVSVPKEWCEKYSDLTLTRKTPRHLDGEDKARYD